MRPDQIPVNDRRCPSCGDLGSRVWTDDLTGRKTDACGSCMFIAMAREAGAIK